MGTELVLMYKFFYYLKKNKNEIEKALGRFIVSLGFCYEDPTHKVVQQEFFDNPVETLLTRVYLIKNF